MRYFIERKLCPRFGTLIRCSSWASYRLNKDVACCLCNHVVARHLCIRYIDDRGEVHDVCNDCVTYGMIVSCCPELESSYEDLAYLSHTDCYIKQLGGTTLYRSQLNALIIYFVNELTKSEAVSVESSQCAKDSVSEMVGALSDLAATVKECQHDALPVLVAKLKRKLDDKENETERKMVEVTAQRDAARCKRAEVTAERDAAKRKLEEVTAENEVLSLQVAEQKKAASDVIANMERLYGEQKCALQEEIQRSNTLAKTSPNGVLLHQNVYLTSMTDMMRGTITSLQTQLMQACSVITHLERFRDDHESHLLELRKAAREAAYGDHQLCVVCQDAPREVVLLFCGHFCVCQACSTKINDKCPVCRQEVNQVSQPVYQC